MFGLFEDPFFSYGSRHMLKRMMEDYSDSDSDSSSSCEDVQTFLPIEPAPKRARKSPKAKKDGCKHAPKMELVPYKHWTDLMNWSPRSDVRETEHAYVIDAELPGVPKDAIKIEVKDNVLTISGKKETTKEWCSESTATEGHCKEGVEGKTEDETKRKKCGNAKPIWHRVERSFGSFQRSYVLPEGVDPSAVTATTKDGTLTITVPKPVKQHQQVHTIAISE